MPGRERVPSFQLPSGTTAERDGSYNLTTVGSIFYNTDTSNVEIRHEDPSNNAAWRDLVVNNREIVDISGEIKVGSINVDASAQVATHGTLNQYSGAAANANKGSVYIGELYSHRTRKFQHIRTPFLHIYDDMHFDKSYPGKDHYHWDVDWSQNYWKNHVLGGTGNEHSSGGTRDGIFFCAEKVGNRDSNNPTQYNGFFIFKWNGYDTGKNNMNVALYMKTYPVNDNHIKCIGFFENDNANSSNQFFTGQHINLLNKNITLDYFGKIVSTTNITVNTDNSIQPSINESLQYCEVTNKDNDKRVFGVISNEKDDNIDSSTRAVGNGSYKSVMYKKNKNERRLYINSLGEGGMWVCNKNGTLENGDYITSSSVPGYGMKQTLNEGLLTNYTVGKILHDCNFSLTKISKQKLKTILHEESSGQSSTEIYYNANGDIELEDDFDISGNQQMVYPYETRFLDSSGNELSDETEYNTKLTDGEQVYIACFVGCTYHCG